MQTASPATSKNSNTSTTRRRAPAHSEYVKALKGAGGFHRQSFHIEMAVTLAFYCDQGTALKAKKQARDIYAKAGFNCADAKGEDYKTVVRRIGAAADLFTYLGGQETLTDWAEGASGANMVGGIVKHLEKRKVDSIAAINALVGKAAVRPYTRRKPVASTTPVPQVDLSKTGPSLAEKMVSDLVSAGIDTQRAVSTAMTAVLPPERVLKTERLVCAIPLDATADEVKNMALMLLEFATSKMGAATAH